MILSAKELAKAYKGRQVVHEVSLQVQQGEVVGLLGPNGAGKTTTFYMIVGLEAPQKGQIYLDGTDITTLPMYLRARRGIGYLTQEASIFRKLSVEDNILAVLEVLGHPLAERRKRTNALLEEFQLTHIRHNKGAVLSGGERRRTEIARALATEPAFILLDEPFTGVDPIAVSDIQGIITQLKDKGLGVLITDHSVRETLSITDRAYIMHQGRILVSGDSQSIIADPVAKKFYLGDRFTL